jgi:hypothetical protein
VQLFTTDICRRIIRLARVKEGRKPEPTASAIDTQSVKTSTNVPLTSQGTDAAAGPA